MHIHNKIKSILNDLGLSEKWVTANIIDKALAKEWRAKLPDLDAEHIRIQFHAKFFHDCQELRLSDSDIEIYLDLVQFKMDATLKSWAIGYLTECGIISVLQLIKLRPNRLLEEKHKVLLEREMYGKIL